MLTESFKTAYIALNSRQKEAVDAIDGPVMVIAGPGTGKTQILALRVANILAKTDTAPDNILALTFTESAAANMRERLVGLLGAPGYYVEIATFHGFANRLIQEFPEYFPAIIGGRNATDVDQISILRGLIEKMPLARLRPLGDKFYYVDDILSAIRTTKQEGYDPETFIKLTNASRQKFENHQDNYHSKGLRVGAMKVEAERELKQIEKNEELAAVYAAYEKELRRIRLYDFEDMILETIRALQSHPDLLAEIRERTHYILVDEHQDTNGAQNRILELLAGDEERPNLFVVGDEKQAIFRFQGASLDNFLYFKNKFAGARLISLEENYRSTQTILDSAQSLIEKNASTIKAPLFARKTSGEWNIRVMVAPTLAEEARCLAKEIKRLIVAGAPPGEIAVLYRENRDAGEIGEALTRANIPFIIESDENLLEDEDIQKLIRILGAISNLGDESRLADALHVDFLDIPPLDIWRVLAERAERGYPSLYALLASEKAIGALGLQEPGRLWNLVQKLEHWKRRSKNESFLKFFPEVIRESGFLEHILASPGSFMKIGKLNALFDEIKKSVGNRGEYNLEDFMEYLHILREHRVSIRAKAAYAPNTVHLMTAHKAKGLEFDHVFIARAVDGKWGNKRRTKKFVLPFSTAIETSELERNEDERRLFYMALTRARKTVTILRSERNADGRELVPSQFLGELRQELVENMAYDGEMSGGVPENFLPPAEPPATDTQGFVAEIFKRRGFSVTALNNYLKCPWRYFYVNLLRLPEAETVPQMYGTAVHAALQRLFSAKAAGEEAGKDYLLARYEEALAREPLSDGDRLKLLASGKKNLGAYFDNYAHSWNYRVLVEYKIEDVVLSENVRLTGKLDKLELTDVPGEAVVVDYKVRRPESRNWIEGKTAGGDGSYKRQLVFYKLLLGSQQGERTFRMKKGVIDFVEPNERGKFKKEEFEIGDFEVAELQEQVLRVADEILSLGFWDKKCGEDDCPYCELRASRKPL